MSNQILYQSLAEEVAPYHESVDYIVDCQPELWDKIVELDDKLHIERDSLSTNEFYKLLIELKKHIISAKQYYDDHR